MKNIITTIAIILTATFALQAQNNAYQVKKNILQSFSTEDVNTVIVKLDDDNVVVRTWEQNMVSVETSLVPVKAKYKALEMLAETGDYDVLAANASDKILIYDNPNNNLVFFKDEKQLFRVEYTIYVPADVAVMDVFRNDLVNSTLAAK